MMPVATGVAAPSVKSQLAAATATIDGYWLILEYLGRRGEYDAECRRRRKLKQTIIRENDERSLMMSG